MSYSRAPLTKSWMLASRARHSSLSGAPAFILSQLPPRATWFTGRGVSTASSKARINDYSKKRSHFVLVLSASVTIGIFLYEQQLSSRPNLLQDAKTPKAHTSTAISILPTGPDQTTLSPLKIYDMFEQNASEMSKLPMEDAILTTAPFVPPPITRDYPVLLRVPLTTTTKVGNPTGQYKYEQWTFNNTVPGPFVRARVGDVMEVSLTNRDQTGNPHNIDSHAFTGPGGGSAVTTAEENETKTGRFKLLHPGVYIYHCAAAPLPVHIANGMYGLMYVQPAEGDLPAVDREYYVMQSEYYHEPPEVLEDGRRSQMVEMSYQNGLREEPSAVVFNGSESAMTRDKPLKAQVGESVRIYFGNAGPNLTSSFHVIGSNFRTVYRDGDVVTPSGHFISTVSVPPGGATIVDMKMFVPGTYSLLDHAIFRLDKGAVGFLNVSGGQRPNIYQGSEVPAPCVGCKLHP